MGAVHGLPIGATGVGSAGVAGTQVAVIAIGIAAALDGDTLERAGSFVADIAGTALIAGDDFATSVS